LVEDVEAALALRPLHWTWEVKYQGWGWMMDGGSLGEKETNRRSAKSRSQFNEALFIELGISLDRVSAIKREPIQRQLWQSQNDFPSKGETNKWGENVTPITQAIHKWWDEHILK
jgi:hypothetical protein